MAGRFRAFLERSGLLNRDLVAQFAANDAAMAEARRQARAASPIPGPVSRRRPTTKSASS
jgi:hypothetical protein